MGPDPSTFQHVVPHVKSIHHAVQAMPFIPAVTHGVSMLTSVISSLVALGLGFGSGWYVKGRGMTGVQIDLNNVKTDVENIKAKLTPAVTPVVTTPTVVA